MQLISGAYHVKTDALLVEVQQPANLVVLAINGMDLCVKAVPQQDVPHVLVLQAVAQHVQMGTIYKDQVELQLPHVLCV